MTVTDIDVMALLQSHERSIENMNRSLERDSREIIEINRRYRRMRNSLEDLEHSIALIHLAMAMLLGCSAGALVISILGAMA